MNSEHARYPAARRPAAIGALALLGLLAGCGDQTASEPAIINGIVTLDDQPLPSGRAVFTPIDQETGGRVCLPIAEGTIQEGPNHPPLPVGRYAVRIVPPAIELAEFVAISSERRALPAALRIPRRYSTGTPFKIRLEAGEVNFFVLEMRSGQT